MTSHLNTFTQPSILLPSFNGCKMPCKHSTNDIRIAPEVTYTPPLNGSSVYVYWNTMGVFESSEHLVYDGSSIVAAVGGSLGLFLGFSCYDIARKMLNLFDKRE